MSRKNILLFGAGKSASVLIDYLIDEAEKNFWNVWVADANLDLIINKTKNRPFSEAIAIDVKDDTIRASLVSKSDIVISMMPPALHVLIAKDCIQFKKSLLTASYADEHIKSLEKEVDQNGLIFLCEMGLDPGIDHMSAMQLIHQIKNKGGNITSFKSHCGGLVAPESDDNPWHYKISWNPRNVVLAGKAGAIYKLNRSVVNEEYENLFDSQRLIHLHHKEVSSLAYYPNRNSLPYIELYELPHTDTFLRTTLRYPSFMEGWSFIVNHHLTNEDNFFESDHKTLSDFFHHYIDTSNLEPHQNIMTQLNFLGLNDVQTYINKGSCSPADILQYALEKKLLLSPQDKDMIVMQHEFCYTLNEKSHKLTSELIVMGDNAVQTAMAKTVGLPLGIAAKMILNDTIQLKGLQIPIHPKIYEPVLRELQLHGIQFREYQS